MRQSQSGALHSKPIHPYKTLVPCQTDKHSHEVQIDCPHSLRHPFITHL